LVSAWETIGQMADISEQAGTVSADIKAQLQPFHNKIAESSQIASDTENRSAYIQLYSASYASYLPLER